MEPALVESTDSRIDVKTLLSRVKELAKHPIPSRGGNGLNLSDFPKSAAAGFDQALATAGQYWAVGLNTPPMNRLPGPLKKAFKPVARAILRVAQVVTRDQRSFNESVLQALRTLRELLATSTARLEQVDEAAAERDRTEAETFGKYSELVRTLQAQQDQSQVELKQAHSSILELGQRMVELQERFKQQTALIQNRLERTQGTVAVGEIRLSTFLEEARRRLPEPFAVPQLTTFSDALTEIQDKFYLAFENHFRGTRDDVRRRAAEYIPLLKAAGSGSSTYPVLDIGCGRGELLEALSHVGLCARGVEVNHSMLEACRERGLTVIEGNGLTYLRGLPDSSLGAVTAIHVIEHLLFPEIIGLLDECLRVLRPGGVIVFETPNPENLLVGACNFYIDPTHLRPLPPAMISFVAEARGFVGVEIQRMRPARTTPGNVPGTLDDVQQHLFGPQDYALIARRP